MNRFAALLILAAPLAIAQAPSAGAPNVLADPTYKAMEKRALLAELRVSILTAQLSQTQLQQFSAYQQAVRDGQAAQTKLQEAKERLGYDDTYDWDPTTQDFKKKPTPAPATPAKK